MPEIVTDWCTVCAYPKPTSCVVFNDEHVCIACIQDACELLGISLSVPDEPEEAELVEA